MAERAPASIRALSEPSFRRRNLLGRRIDVCRKRRGKSKIHRHEEAVNARLATACVIPVKDPIVSVLAWQRLPNGYAMNVTIDRVIVVGDAVNLVRPKMMSVSRPAT